MLITASNIFRTILNQLEFLAQIKPAITVQADGQWVTKAIFSDIFRYTQLLSSAEILDMNLCNPFLFIRNENESVCKYGSEIRFSNEACSTMVNQMIRLSTWPDSSFTYALSKLPLGQMHTFVENKDELVVFPNVNSKNDF